MFLLEVLLLSLALIIDSFTISLSYGLVEKRETLIKHMGVVGLTCAVGQVLFVLLGWVIGTLVSQLVLDIAGIVGFVLLSGLGVYMTYEAIKHWNAPLEKPALRLTAGTLFFLVVTTSFDVLSVGAVLGILGRDITWLVVSLFFFTVMSAYVGGYLGFVIGDKFGQKAQIIGAALIFVLAFMILL